MTIQKYSLRLLCMLCICSIAFGCVKDIDFEQYKNVRIDPDIVLDFLYMDADLSFVENITRFLPDGESYTYDKFNQTVKFNLSDLSSEPSKYLDSLNIYVEIENDSNYYIKDPNLDILIEFLDSSGSNIDPQLNMILPLVPRTSSGNFEAAIQTKTYDKTQIAKLDDVKEVKVIFPVEVDNTFKGNSLSLKSYISYYINREVNLTP